MAQNIVKHVETKDINKTEILCLCEIQLFRELKVFNKFTITLSSYKVFVNEQLVVVDKAMNKIRGRLK